MENDSQLKYENIPELEDEENFFISIFSEYEEAEQKYLEEHPNEYKIAIGKTYWALTEEGHFRDGGINLLKNIDREIRCHFYSFAKAKFDIYYVRLLEKLGFISLEKSVFNQILHQWEDIIEWRSFSDFLDEKEKDKEAELMQFLYNIDAKKIAEQQEQESLASYKCNWEDIINKLRTDFNR